MNYGKAETDLPKLVQSVLLLDQMHLVYWKNKQDIRKHKAADMLIYHLRLIHCKINYPRLIVKKVLPIFKNKFQLFKIYSKHFKHLCLMVKLLIGMNISIPMDLVKLFNLLWIVQICLPPIYQNYLV